MTVQLLNLVSQVVLHCLQTAVVTKFLEKLYYTALAVNNVCICTALLLLYSCIFFCLSTLVKIKLSNIVFQSNFPFFN